MVDLVGTALANMVFKNQHSAHSPFSRRTSFIRDTWDPLLSRFHELKNVAPSIYERTEKIPEKCHDCLLRMVIIYHTVHSAAYDCNFAITQTSVM